ncbi:MAG TPA: hypothetical protein V6D08_16995 [Candidatus Obscuribacterales bacterium]
MTSRFLQALMIGAVTAAAGAPPGMGQLDYGQYGSSESGYPGSYGGGQAAGNGGYPGAGNGSGAGYPGGTAATYGGGYGSGYQRPAPSPGQPANPARVRDWFSRYDQIRRQAQMTPQERQRADTLLSRGMAILMPGPDKDDARQILTMLVNKYQTATQAMKQLPLIPETQDLHRGYYQYFNNARQLFTDYLRVQDNIFVTDASTGKPIAGQLLQRKAMLEQLNQQIQGLDAQLRSQLGIAPYRYF